jgi:hypothetical protein
MNQYLKCPQCHQQLSEEYVDDVLASYFCRSHLFEESNNKLPHTFRMFTTPDKYYSLNINFPNVSIIAVYSNILGSKIGIIDNVGIIRCQDPCPFILEDFNHAAQYIQRYYKLLTFT